MKTTDTSFSLILNTYYSYQNITLENKKKYKYLLWQEVTYKIS